uniref:Microfibril associated protein 1 n=1 Tax=Myotis myotis TaxID=51298 RepID=A0A7J8ANA6_MYOMY|nr:microfibril associated protein 1 [Myotis myotis]
MCRERGQTMPLWSPQMRRMKNFSSLRKPKNKKQSLRNRRRIHLATPDYGVCRTVLVKMWKRDWLDIGR